MPSSWTAAFRLRGVSDRSFEPGEVERLIPALTRLMERVMRCHAEATTIRERLRAEQERIAAVGGGVIDRGKWKTDRDRLAGLAREVEAGVNEIVAMGGVPKDLGLGLVDFLHLREGREVNLCWKYGESSIRYWHGLDEGYTGRKPL